LHGICFTLGTWLDRVNSVISVARVGFRQAGLNSRTPATLTNRKDNMTTSNEAAAQLDVNKEKLISDMKVVLSDAEVLLKSAAAATGEKAHELRERAAASLKQAAEKMSDLQVVAREKGTAAAHAADDYVHTNPWTAVGIAAAAGFVLGLLVGRR